MMQGHVRALMEVLSLYSEGFVYRGTISGFNSPQNGNDWQ